MWNFDGWRGGEFSYTAPFWFAALVIITAIAWMGLSPSSRKANEWDGSDFLGGLGVSVLCIVICLIAFLCGRYNATANLEAADVRAQMPKATLVTMTDVRNNQIEFTDSHQGCKSDYSWTPGHRLYLYNSFCTAPYHPPTKPGG